jgi:hypothetical protein
VAREDGSQQLEEVFIVQGELPPSLVGYRYDQLNLYLTKTSKFSVANAYANRMSSYQGSSNLVSLAFIISGTGELTVLHSSFDLDTGCSWRMEPWDWLGLGPHWWV